MTVHYGYKHTHLDLRFFHLHVPRVQQGYLSNTNSHGSILSISQTALLLIEHFNNTVPSCIHIPLHKYTVIKKNAMS